MILISVVFNIVDSVVSASFLKEQSFIIFFKFAIEIKYNILMKNLIPVLLLILFSTCTEKQLPPPNILWITAEDIGPAFGCYGDEYATTPNIDQLADGGVVFSNAYATAPICAPARSCLITGVYATSMGTQHLRSDIEIPEYLKTIPEVLRTKGYYTSNNSKTDYNFDPSGRWDENGGEAHWKNRADNKPFFSVFNYGITHEGSGNSYDDKHTKNLKQHHDPSKAEVPPYFPDTEEFRTIWARYYDLITAFDNTVGEHMAELEEAGILENTIVFVFSDHGFGLPRYKRWLYNTGLQVPLIVYVPEKYQEKFNMHAGDNDQMVSFADYAPTVLQLAGIDKKEYMQGQSFLTDSTEKSYTYGARSRADDVYDVSRAIVDDRYIYIRNYMPHLSYVQDAVIFSENKRSFAELLRLKSEGSLNPEAKQFWEPKPVEELYDLQNDPYELNNLAGIGVHNSKLTEMRDRLRRKALETRDIGFLHESEYMRRAQGTTPYDYAQSDQYNIERIFETAQMVGDESTSNETLFTRLKDEDSGVRYWAIIALMQRLDNQSKTAGELRTLLNDASPAVALAAAEALCKINREAEALPVIEKYIKLDDEPTTVLHAAMVARRIGKKACPLVDVVRNEYEKYKGDVWGRYKSWSYPMFIGFAFDQIRMNCGEELNLTKS